MPKALGVGDGQRTAGSRSECKQAKAFAHRERRCDHRAAATVAILAGWNSGGEEDSHDGVAVLLVPRKDAALGVEREIAEAVLLAIGAVEEGRDVDKDLNAPLGNELQSLAIAVIPHCKPGWVVLVDEVGAQLLLQPRRHRDQRGNPVRLLVLRRRHARLIALDEGLRGARRRLGWRCRCRLGQSRSTAQGERKGQENAGAPDLAQGGKFSNKRHIYGYIQKITTFLTVSADSKRTFHVS